MTGTFVGIRETRPCAVVRVKSPEHGKQAFDCPPLLRKKLAGTETNSPVRITCVGSAIDDNGWPYWAFEVATT